MKMRFVGTLVAGFIIALASSAMLQAAPPDNLVKATLLSDTSAVEAGKPFRIGVMLKITPHWHLYWSNPGDGGIPTTVELKLPEGFTSGGIEYPIPSKIESPGGITNIGYENEVMLMATITPPAKIDSSKVTIGAEANWLVCEKSCVPGDVKLSIDLPVGKSQPAEREAFAKWIPQLPVLMKEWPFDITRRINYANPKTGTLSLQLKWTKP